MSEPEVELEMGVAVVDCGLPAATKRANLWLSMAALTNSSSFLTWLRICTVCRRRCPGHVGHVYWLSSWRARQQVQC